MLLRRKANQRQLTICLEKLGSQVTEQGGYWTLSGVAVDYPSRQSERWFRYKWRRLGLAVRILKWAPYVRMVAATNTVADRTAKRDSDIDVLIVIEHGRLYLGRLIVTVLLHLTGLRRHGQKVANRICLSFFVSTAGQDLSGIRFQPYDIYLAYWVSELQPVLADGQTHQDFLTANRWVAPFVPHYHEGPEATSRPDWSARLGERIFNTYLGDRLEQRVAAWQQARIRVNQDRQDPDVLIVATDRMLKFHEKERRRVYRDQWEELMKSAGENPRRILD